MTNLTKIHAVRRIAGIIVLFAIIGFSMIACDGNGGNGGTDPLNGTWTSGQYEWTFKNGTYELKENGKLDEKGTYTTKASSRNASPSKGIMELTPTHINGENWYISSPGDLEEKWYSKDDLKKQGIGDGQINTIFAVEEKEYEVDGNTLTLDGTSYTKQGGSTPGGGGKWTVVADSKFGSSKINAIVYGGNKFVAVGESGKMAYSADGITWTAVANSTFGGTGINAIAYGGGKFVAGGNGSKMAYSSDGINWTAVADSAFGSGNYIEAIAYGGGKFVAGGDTGTFGVGIIAYSSDGINWTAVDVSNLFPSNANDNIEAIAYGNNKFIAGGASGKLAYSPDGITWSAVETPSTFSNGFDAIIWSGNKFVASIFDKVTTSTDGINWTPLVEVTKLVGIEAIAWGNNRFAAGGVNGFTWHSTDGITWTAFADQLFYSGYSSIYYTINGIAYGGNKFVAVATGEIAYWQP